MTAERVIRPMLCPLCEAACGLDVHVEHTAAEGAEVALIRGRQDDVFSHGYLCPKGTALRAFHDDPDRLRRPLVKRDGRFVEVDFDEAFAEVQRRLVPVVDEHGPLAAGLVIGNPTVHRTGLVLYALDLAAALGSPNVFSTATLDQMPKQLAVGRMYGDFYSIPVPDLERTHLLVVLGANPVVSNGSMWSVPGFRDKARAMLDRGGALVTVDPRHTETAALGGDHLPLRPGTDAFLLAAIVNAIADRGLIDLGPAASHLAGLEAVLDAVGPYTPDRVADSCGLTAGAITELAVRIAEAPTAAVYGRIGTCHQVHATVTSWLIEVVNIVTGNLDRPGGTLFSRPPAFATNTVPVAGEPRGVTTGSYRSRVSGAPEVMNQFPLACLAEEIATSGEGQIRALVTVAANPVLSGPDGPKLDRALGQLDATVCLDVYLNETTRHADVIIPGPSPLEEGHYDVFFSQFAYRNVARYTPPVLPVPPGPGQAPPDWEIVARLVGLLRGDGPAADPLVIDEQLTRELLTGYGIDDVDPVLAALEPRVGAERRLDLALRTGPYGDWFGANPDGLTLAQLEATPAGVDFGPLEPRLPEVLRTPSGRVELAPPDFVAALVEAEADLDAPAAECVLVGRRHLRSNNSWMHNLPVLVKGRHRCTLLVNPDDAARWGLADGGEAVVSSEATGASVTVPVEVDDSMMAGVVSLPHGWGHDHPEARLAVARERPGSNVNVLAGTERRDPLSGNAALSGIPVSVRPGPG